jgi:hypothetical protein
MEFKERGHMKFQADVTLDEDEIRALAHLAKYDVKDVVMKLGDMVSREFQLDRSTGQGLLKFLKSCGKLERVVSAADDADEVFRGVAKTTKIAVR